MVELAVVVIMVVTVVVSVVVAFAVTVVGEIESVPFEIESFSLLSIDFVDFR